MAGDGQRHRRQAEDIQHIRVGLSTHNQTEDRMFLAGKSDCIEQSHLLLYTRVTGITQKRGQSMAEGFIMIGKQNPS